MIFDRKELWPFEPGDMEGLELTGTDKLLVGASIAAFFVIVCSGFPNKGSAEGAAQETREQISNTLSQEPELGR